MKALFDQLIQLLESETELYLSIYEMMQVEKNAILTSDAENLIRINGDKEALLLHANQLAERRAEMLQALGQYTDQSVEGLTLTELARHMPPEKAQRLQLVADQLRDLVQKAVALNNDNKRLVQDGLEFVKGALTLINQAMGTPPVYGKSGKMRDTSSGSGRVLHDVA